MTTVAERERRRRARAQFQRAAAASAGLKKKHAQARAAPAANPAKNSVLHRLRDKISRQQLEAGCRLRDDWLDGLDAKTGTLDSDGRGPAGGDVPHERLLRQGAARASFDRASQALLDAEGIFVHNRVIVACVRDERPEEMARRLARASGEDQQKALERIMREIRIGLEALARHYAGQRDAARKRESVA